jgi:hypothetical protein
MRWEDNVQLLGQICALCLSLPCRQKKNKGIFHVKEDITDIGTQAVNCKVLPLGIMFIVWTVYAFLPATYPTL